MPAPKPPAFETLSLHAVGIECERDLIGDLQGRLPDGDVEQEVVAGLRGGARPPCPDRERAVPRPELERSRRKRHARTLSER